MDDEDVVAAAVVEEELGFPGLEDERLDGKCFSRYCLSTRWSSYHE